MIEKTSQTAKYSFKIELNDKLNQVTFRNADLRSVISLKIEDNLKFSGYITNILRRNKKSSLFEIICYDQSSIMSLERFTSECELHKGSSADMIAFLIDISHSDIYYTETSLKGLHGENRLFEVIIPITNLKISNNLVLGDCIITSQKPSIDKILKSKLLTSFKVFARISLRRNSYYIALIDGLKFIKSAISLINFRLKFPSFLNSYNIKDQRTTIKLADYIYIKDLKYHNRFIFELPINKFDATHFRTITNKYLDPIKQSTDYYINPNYKFSEDDQKVFWILHYLNSSESKSDLKESFLDLWIAFDFLISTYSPKIQPFSKSDLIEIRNFCSGYNKFKEEELLKDNELDDLTRKNYTKKYQKCQERLIEIINTYFNSPSFRKKLEALLQRFDMRLSQKEWKLFEDARRKRNQIIHGKETQVLSEEYMLISKIIYFILKINILDNISIKEDNEKNYLCIKCDTTFNQKTKPRTFRNQEGTTLGSMCEECYNNFVSEKFKQINLLCEKCGLSFHNVNADAKTYETNKGLLVKFMFKCPKCKNHQISTILIDRSSPELFQLLD